MCNFNYIINYIFFGFKKKNNYNPELKEDFFNEIIFETNI